MSSERMFTLEQLLNISEAKGVLCLSDHASIADFPNRHDPELGREISKALRPSHELQVRSVM